MLDILAIGEIVIDFSPLFLSKNGNPVYEAQPGGAPSNLLAAASRLGAKTGLMGVVGKDPLGDFLCTVTKKYGIDDKGLRQTELAPTPVTLVVYDENGDRSFHSLQTDTALNQISVENLDLEMIKSSRILHLAGSLLSLKNGLPVYEKAKCHAKKFGRLTCCDLNWRPHMYGRSYAQRVFPRYLEGLDILKISHEELELLTNTWDLEAGSQKLRELGIRVVCVTLGAAGSYFNYAGGRAHLFTYNTKVVDTNASGDVFTAAMLVKLLEKNCVIDKIPFEDMKQIMDFANAAGAVCASLKGAICAAPDRIQIQECRRNVPFLKMEVPGNLDDGKESDRG